ncbi:sugar ABC transporter substrate-binding protein [Rhodococcus sp. WMMA185]|uniref:sugar ABC transporter substrate-binding protein n=1 Tax=Rhodococcus sp. WMMA185 TaxID=679318 RepID=UPI0008787189|nr:sugar ABC transporter substrate-binding protein [Rhodococcus sp. WMMA185]AOW92159.1 sugar ABC transporter substrate-binding protein [Rhodococcus sp. WMMA185]
MSFVAGRRRLTVLAGSTVVVLGLAACSSTGGRPNSSEAETETGTADTPRATVAMITHEVAGDSFWDLVRKGAEAAAAKDNIELRYSSDPEAPNQASLVQNAIDSEVDGIAVTLAKPEALAPSVRDAVADGIPVTALNAGMDEWKKMGVTAFFGQDEEISGEAAGQRLNADGATNSLCVIHEQGNVGHEARCAGVVDGFDGDTKILYVNGEDMPSVESTITAKLQQDPSIDYVLTMGAPYALTAVTSVANAGSNARVATFDTNAELVDAIGSGEVEWAVDQQPFLQGYLAVDSLWLYLNNGNVIGGGMPTLTGPAFIDSTNIDSVAEYARNGTR